MPDTANYRLRVEGVNLGNFVEDVQDLSTIRGGGLLMLSVPERVKKIAKKQGIVIDPISMGASSGLFNLTCGDAEAESLRESLVEDFDGDAALRHATIVVDLMTASGDFIRDRESLIALNRWQQMTAPSLAVPSSSAARVCEFDLIRPATTTQSEQRASASVAARRKFGKDQKKTFYLEELRRKTTPADTAATRVATAGFVNDLTELTDGDPSQKNLETKMAVVYFDGNKFGQIQDRHCRSADDQRTFDTAVRDYRTAALERLLATMDGDETWQTVDGRYRLETLLWGGDEMIWVVPAWQGWRVAQLFYETSASWTFGDAPLTHAGGIVFSHHKANIHRMTNLARKLANIVKKTNGADPRNAFAYQVLESFDFVSGDLDDFRRSRVPIGVDAAELVLSGSAMTAATSAIGEVKSRLPNNKLHDIVRGLRKESVKDQEMTQKLIETTLAAAFPDSESRGVFESLKKSFGGTDTAWFHLAELWDYFPAPRVVSTGAEVTA
jgi:hypothetical protein